jgi:hypothetical protein
MLRRPDHDVTRETNKCLVIPNALMITEGYTMAASEDMWTEIRVVLDSFFKVQSIYFTWYGWFMALQATSLGLLLVNRLQTEGAPTTAVALVWIGASLSALAGCYFMYTYFRSAFGRICALMGESAPDYPRTAAIVPHSAFIAVLVGAAFTFALSVVGWGYMIYWNSII